jgi:hypothetical protein
MKKCRESKCFYIPMSIVAFTLLIVGINTALAQNFIFEITPIIRPVNALTFSTKAKMENSSVGGVFEFAPSGGKLGAIFIRASLQSDIQIDLLKYNSRLKFGILWGTNTFASRNQIISNGTVSLQSESIDFTEKIRSTNLYYFQTIALTAKISLNQTENEKRIRHNLISGVGVNLSLGNNVGSSQSYRLSKLDNSMHYTSIVEKNQGPLQRFFPALFLRYELCIHKKNGNALLNLYLTYNQGFRYAYKISTYSAFSTGSTIEVVSKTRGSGFSFGIGKTLYYKMRDNKAISTLE